MPIGDKLQCLRCGHPWTTRIDSKPVACPDCHSQHWDEPYKPQFPHECLKCGEQWSSRAEHPFRCPFCWSSTWDYPPFPAIQKEEEVV